MFPAKLKQHLHTKYADSKDNPIDLLKCTGLYDEQEAFSNYFDIIH
jgi:hypothetical protein